jgi:hypothetical protein
MELVRKAALVIGTVAVALGVGYGVQNGAETPPEPAFNAEAAGRGKPVATLPTQQADNFATIPKAITPLAAGLEQDTTIVPWEADRQPLPQTAFAPKTDRPEMGAEPLAEARPADCPVTLDVIAADKATLDLTLIAPCRASERLVLRHGGLAITGMTSLTGTMFASLPGMDAAGEVSILFADGQEVTAAAALPDLHVYRRFAVQWMADDSFQINAFENGARFGQAGHVSIANPQRVLANIPTRGGYLTSLGDRTASVPMLAEVYTFPTEDDASVDLTLEATVTTATCDRELLGEVLFSESGAVAKTDLSMSMPTCDGIGDVLVLNNPLPDLKLAAVN